MTAPLLQELALELLIGKNVHINAILTDNGSKFHEVFDGILRKLGDMFIINDGDDYITFTSTDVKSVAEGSTTSLIEVEM